LKIDNDKESKPLGDDPRSPQDDDDEKAFYDKLVSFNGASSSLNNHDDNDADNEPTDENDLERLIGSQCRDDELIIDSHR